MGRRRYGRGKLRTQLIHSHEYGIIIDMHPPQTNRLASLRLTERCADMLISVREEIVSAGDAVTDELRAPVAKLNECASHSKPSYVMSDPSSCRAFLGVLQLLTKLGQRPFLKRYLRRDEIAFHISSCDAALNDALGMFGVRFLLHWAHGNLMCFTLAAVDPNSHA
jgi:hypothetical protein